MASERLMKAYEVVLGQSIIGAEEYLTRSASAMTKARVFGRVMFNAQVEGFETAAIWVPRLTGLFGLPS